jgi:hypothetical protein
LPSNEFFVFTEKHLENSSNPPPHEEKQKAKLRAFTTKAALSTERTEDVGLRLFVPAKERTWYSLPPRTIGDWIHEVEFIPIPANEKTRSRACPDQAVSTCP